MYLINLPDGSGRHSGFCQASTLHEAYVIGDGTTCGPGLNDRHHTIKGDAARLPWVIQLSATSGQPANTTPWCVGWLASQQPTQSEPLRHNKHLVCDFMK